MILEDRIYGREKIDEKILIEIIKSKEFERLKGVSQLGLPEEYYIKKGFSRHEHSLGVFLLLRKLGASLEEQVAGLLHDINHLSFSHVIDWLLGDPTKDDYQDKNYFNFLKKSSLPSLLEREGFELDLFSDLSKFVLLEREAPSLCADRIDYSLREISIDGDEKKAKNIFNDLIVREKQVMFRSLEYANLFAKEYSSLQINSWASEKSRSRYFILSEILKESFNKKIISLKDLEKPESEILNNLEIADNYLINKNLNLLKKGFDLVEDEKGISLNKKFRYIDPEISINGSYKKLSEISSEYFNFIEKEKIRNNFTTKFKIVPLKK